MSNKPAPDSTDQDNPYNQRNHEQGGTINRDEVLAVAGLLGTVTGQLKEIDRQNVGGSNPFTQAVKMDPKQALQKIVKQNVISPPPATAPQQTAHVPVPQPFAPPPEPLVEPITTSPPVANNTDLEKRVYELEKIISTYKKIEKFKRGVAYTISTSKIKGTFKDPSDILDIISSELAKQTKTITIKLDVPDKTK